ncbi:uncharacterized protein A1O5_00147 [Cladophialophora psammophila CBS 110553]|uniref:Major facilitator superfamily (MFS) profile domain-containing protein n=1 Tax=Cladophialophora psammophila CBS 110553 TaxID=1182543 RepID=W9XE78_9EURO|nr:uncharacterized protein A1O5_00147 [Cladophialophora psammophila CBS 110553]EXJ75640.1 hypothetical protein A1O5_00147 [Cladophialophora psammophila CBS 110553]
MGVIIGLTAGLYQALNLLGAGGGKPSSYETVQIVNSTLCAIWFFSSAFGGTVLNTIGPALSSCIGVIGFILYVGGLWYFDDTGRNWFAIFGGVAIGLSAGLIWVTMGSIAMSYSEEQERGSFIAMSVNLQAVGAAIGGLIPLVINRNRTDVAGVPTAVYVIILAMMGVAGLLSFLLRDPWKIVRDDGTRLFTVKSRGWIEELKSNLEIFKDWKLLIMVPAFLPSETFLVYSGSVNAYHNNLRTRCLLSFMAVICQVPCGYGLQKILDHKTWHRRKRAFIGLAVVGTSLIAAWTWEIIRVRDYDRRNPPTHPLDWSEPRFAPIFILFVMTWVSSVLFQYIILYFLSAMTNSPRKSAVYAGVYRSFLAAGEAICFGLDSIAVPYIKEAGTIFAFYATGVIVFIYLAAFHITETEYFTGEEGVVIPKHVVEENPEKAADAQVEMTIAGPQQETSHEEKRKELAV